MGTYINPGNDGFARILQGEYVDKTGIIGLTNKVIGSAESFVCITRPRRFGKSFAAHALVAYYSYGCNSLELFRGLDVARDPSFTQHLNAYNLIRLDMTEFTGDFGADVVSHVQERLQADLAKEFPQVPRGDWLTASLLEVVRATGRRFVFVIDEWDAPFRDAHANEAAQERFVKFLRTLFKNASFTPEAIALAYMTGILPIKRYGTQSALTDFREYTMLDSASYAPYVGFLEADVQELSVKHAMDMSELRRWYDGYELPKVGPAYAPYSVMEACERGQCKAYWTSSEAFEMLRMHIDLDLDGLQGSIVQLLGGASVPVDVEMFNNDMREVHSRDDALTLLVHLGYLVYDGPTKTVHIPNEEVRAELRRATSQSRHAEVARIVRESEQLLVATWDLDADEVCSALQRAHDTACTPVFYNNEQALRAVIKSAYIAAADHYATIQELPSGRGIADVVYLPKRGDPSPALVVELKWNRTPQAALAQIKDRDYPAVLREWGGPILMVGVTYDPKSKEHHCSIEETLG